MRESRESAGQPPHAGGWRFRKRSVGATPSTHAVERVTPGVKRCQVSGSLGGGAGVGKEGQGRRERGARTSIPHIPPMSRITSKWEWYDPACMNTRA